VLSGTAAGGDVDAVVAAVLPEPRERAAQWQERYDLPFPLLADPSESVSETYDQPTRFGAPGSLHDMVGRMPEAVVFDARSGAAEVAAVDEGATPADRPDLEVFLGAVRSLDGADP